MFLIWALFIFCAITSIMLSMKMIEIKDLVFSYDKDNLALDHLNLSIEKGSYTTIIGHNGSGKSTLAKLIAGLLPITSGEIKIDGCILNDENINTIRNKLGIVFQNPDNQFIGSTVRDDIAFGLENYMVESSKMDEIINDYASKVNMEAFLDKEPGSLSGGQKQRVAIAGVLAMKPDILILDEATSMLDPKGRKEIKALIHKLHDEYNLTILSITHDIEETLYADNCIVLNKGKVFAYGKADEVFKDVKKIKEIGLDIPYLYEIKAKFKQNGINLKSDTMEGVAQELWQLSSKI